MSLTGLAIDIHSKGKWPSNALSNFYPHEFVFEGMKCGSMEGFLQSLKTDDREEQKIICQLSGKEAKLHSTDTWKKSQIVFWNGRKLNRQGPQFQNLLLRVYREMAKQNPIFRDALHASGKKLLFHSIGNPDSTDTILTEKELCNILAELRREIQTYNEREA